MARHWKSSDPYPQGATFGELLDWHLVVGGTNPKSTPAERSDPWVKRNFAELVHSGLPATEEENNPERKLWNWRYGVHLPREGRITQNIFDALFGDNQELADWKRDLEQALEAERETKALRPARGYDVPQTEILRFPRPTAHFMGRDEAVGTLSKMLTSPARPSAVLVQGGPGIGKTELTKAIAHHPDIAAHFAARRFFVPVETATSAVAMQDAIIDAVGSDHEQGFSAALIRLNEQPALLVLDNLETPWTPMDQRQGTERALSDLAALPNVAVLASFRGREAVGGPRWHEYELEVLSPPLAIDLFASLAGLWTRADPHIEMLTDALGGIPLAIQLIAHRAHGRVSLAPLWEEWLKVGADLAMRPGFEAGRLTSLPHSIELSLRPMEGHSALRLFALLGVLPAGLALYDAERLLGNDTFVAIERLCQAGIAQELDDRVDLLPPIREHARRHYEPGDADDVAWVTHFLGLAEKDGANIGTANDQGLLQLLSPDFANIEAAFRRAVHQSRHSEIASAVAGFSSLAFTGSRPTDIFYELGAFFSDRGDAPNEALCLRSIGDLARARTDFGEALSAYNAALVVLRNCDDRPGIAVCQLFIGEIAIHRGDYDLAREIHEEALALYNELGDTHGAAGCVKGLGEIALFQSAYDEARSRHEEAAAMYAESQKPLGVANCVLTLAEIALFQGHHEIARAHYEDTLTRYEAMGYVLGQANCHHGLGNVAFDLADYQTAWSAYDRALALYEAIGNALGEANCAQCFGDLAIALDEIDQAQHYFENALDRYRIIGNLPLPMANCFKGLGDVALHRGELEEAQKIYRTAMVAYAHCGNIFGEADCMTGLGDIAVRQADYPTARRQFNEAIRLYREIGNAAYEEKCLQKLAQI